MRLLNRYPVPVCPVTGDVPVQQLLISRELATEKFVFPAKEDGFLTSFEMTDGATE